MVPNDQEQASSVDGAPAIAAPPTELRDLFEEVRELINAIYWARGLWSKDDKKRICATLVKCRDALRDGARA